MQKLVFRNANGIELDLTSGDYGITEWEGFSAVSLNVQSQQVPFQDGSVYLDGLLGERELSVTVAMQDKNNLEKRYQLRRQMISVLNPKLGEGVLIYTNDYISKQIHCVAQMPVFENHNSNDSGTPKASCSFTACNPYWEDLEDTVVDCNYGEVLEVDNKGDVKTQVKVELFTQGVENPTVMNMTTNQKIKIQGEVNNNIIINTNNGEKGVKEETININVSQESSYLGGFCYSERLGMYLATGYFIRFSYDGKEWETLYNNITSTRGVAYAEDKGLFIALAGQQYYYTSTDGILWEKRNTPSSSDGEYRAVIYIEEEGKFYIANYYYLYESTDGINWQKITSLNLHLPTVFYYDKKNLLFIIGDDDGNITKTTDFENWETITTTSTSIHDIIYDGSKYFCFSSKIVSSSDLETWGDVTPAIPEGYTSMSINCAVYNDVISKYVAGGALYTGATLEPIELNSDDGETWEITTNNKNEIQKNIFVKTTGVTLQGSNKGDIYLSLDLVEWKNETEKDINGWLRFISFSEDKKMFVGISLNDIYTSYDGIRWVLENTERPNIGNFQNLCYLEKTGQFLIGGSDGSIKSSDGKNWERVGYYSNDHRLKTIYAKKLGLYYQVDTYSNGGLWRSEDGIVYEKVYNVSHQNNVYILDVTYSEKQNILVIVGDNRVCRSSDGGDTWIEDFSETGKSVAYSKDEDIFVKISETTNNMAIIKTSKDGSVWEEQFEFQQGVSPRSLAYSDSLNLFFAPELYNNKKILLSSNGKEWKEEEVSFLGYFSDYAYGGCVVVSNILKTFVFSNFSESFCLYYTTLKEGENMINLLSSDTDMTFYLKTGINKIRMQKEDGNFSCRISYRQKYIGV